MNAGACDFCQRTDTTLVPNYHLDKPRMICAPGTGCNEDMGGDVVCGINGLSPRCVSECTYPSCSCAADTLRAMQAAQDVEVEPERWLTLDEIMARACALECGPVMLWTQPRRRPGVPRLYPQDRVHHVVLVLVLPARKTKEGE